MEVWAIKPPPCMWKKMASDTGWSWLGKRKVSWTYLDWIGFTITHKDLFKKNRGRHSSNYLLYLLQFFMNKTLSTCWTLRTNWIIRLIMGVHVVLVSLFGRPVVQLSGQFLISFGWPKENCPVSRIGQFFLSTLLNPFSCLFWKLVTL